MSFHKIVSFIKSGIRIAGFVFLLSSVFTGAILLVLAEVFGVVEELKEK